MRFLGEHQKQHADKPFFMYVTFTAAHWPMHALPEDIAKYDGKYDGGYGPTNEKLARYLGRLFPEESAAPITGVGSPATSSPANATPA